MYERYLTMDPEAVLTETPELVGRRRRRLPVAVAEGRWVSDQNHHRRQNDHQLVIVTRRESSPIVFAPLDERYRCGQPPRPSVRRDGDNCGPGLSG